MFFDEEKGPTCTQVNTAGMSYVDGGAVDPAAPASPSVFIAYNEDTMKLELRDLNGAMISQCDLITVKGKDGDDAYHLWKRAQASGTDTSFEAFLQAFKGASGSQGLQGPVGPKGEPGDVWVPAVTNDGCYIYFIGPQGQESEKYPIKGAKGDRGEKGDQGQRGETGQRGMSAYEIWLKAGNIGTEADFLESLKGEKGDPFDPNKLVEFNVEDYCCPIQQIDTNLIVDKGTTQDDAETIIDKRISVIEQIRKEGCELASGWQYWSNPINLIKEFTWICAGADRPLLRKCPGDHSKYVGIGTVILFTALMAWFSSFVAMRLVFDVVNNPENNFLAIIFASFWSAMIFCLDRFITNTMYSDGKVSISRQEFLSGLPRIVIAIFLGIVISAPLELMIFDDAINEELLRKAKADVIAQEKEAWEHIGGKQADEIFKINISIETLRSDKRDALDEKNGLVSPEPYSQLISPAEYTVDEHGNQVMTKDAVYKINYSSKAAFRKAQENYNAAVGRCDRKITECDSLISIYQNQKLKIDTLSDTLFVMRQTEINEQITNADNGLLARLSTLHDLAMKEYRSFHDGSKSNGAIDYFTLHPLWYYLLCSPIGLIMLLFVLIDISPVLYKMMLADGKYDNYLHQDKLLEQDKIRMTLAKMLNSLNDSELKRVAPFIMGDIYEKMAGESYVYKTEEEYRAEMQEHSDVHPVWRLWPFSLFRRIFWNEKVKPSAPVIIMEKKTVTPNEQLLAETNEEVFKEVLEMKRKLIIDSYRRWYKTQQLKVNPNSTDGFVASDEI